MLERDLVTQSRRRRIQAFGRGLVARAKLARCASVGHDVVVLGRVLVHGGGRIVVGNRVVIDGVVAPVELFASPDAEIRIGDDARLGPGVSIECRERVTVGARSRLGAYAKLLDNHLHQVEGRGDRPPSSPIVLEEDVEVSARAVLLPGARLGRGSIVGPATVVSRPVPAGHAIRGAPPRVSSPSPPKETP